MSVPKAVTAAFSKGELFLHKEIIISVVMLSQARRGYEVILICLPMNNLHKWILNTNNTLR